MIQIFKKSGAKIRVLFESGGGNICCFWYTFFVLGVSFVGNATPNLYSLTFFGLSSSFLESVDWSRNTTGTVHECLATLMLCVRDFSY